MRKTFWVTVQIECLDAQTKSDAKKRVLSWLETFGHTASSHGFEFLKVGGLVDEPEAKS
jgi:hypothetical protein